MSGQYTTIRVSKDVKDRLDAYGDMGMSYDEVIERVLDRLESQEDSR